MGMQMCSYAFLFVFLGTHLGALQAINYSKFFLRTCRFNVGVHIYVAKNLQTLVRKNLEKLKEESAIENLRKCLERTTKTLLARIRRQIRMIQYTADVYKKE